jgi:nitrogen-specific signal transduction histidine kinase
MEEQMDDKKAQDVQSLQLRFIGKILAGFTHEIKNHLAIVKESVGLMGDMMQIHKTPESDFSQYLQIIRSIEEQIEKAIVHFRYLNRFSHRMDTPLSSFNINESLEELTALIDRFAAQKKIVLERDFKKDLPSINSSPAILQFLVFNFLEDKMAKLDKNSSIIVKTEVIKDSVTIRLIPQGNVLPTETEKSVFPHHEIQNYLINLLHGTISTQGEETVFTIPLAGA